MYVKKAAKTTFVQKTHAFKVDEIDTRTPIHFSPFFLCVRCETKGGGLKND